MDKSVFPTSYPSAAIERSIGNSRFVGIDRNELARLRGVELRDVGQRGHYSQPAPRREQTSAELAQQAEQQAVREETLAEKTALNNRISYEVALANATIILLASLRSLLLGEVPSVAPQAVLAKFRKELQPLAETYGVKIVCVGDKTTATLVK